MSDEPFFPIDPKIFVVAPSPSPTDNYPGLRLGCVVEPVSGQYCGELKASPGDGDCDFYMSCCYGELALQASVS